MIFIMKQDTNADICKEKNVAFDTRRTHIVDKQSIVTVQFALI